MMPENSFQILNDETFPGSLLIEFDELDDDIPISPTRILVPENNIAVLDSQSSVATSQTNSSSEHYNSSIEHDNGSGSSNSSNIYIKHHATTTNKRTNMTKNANTSIGKSSSSSSSSEIQKRSKSEGNLLNASGSHIRTGVLRSRKYGHVKSKVKQYIDETLSQHSHRPFVRHKSLPVSTNDAAVPGNAESEIEQDASMLRAMLEEKSELVNNLQRHLDFSEMLRRDDIAKIEALKQKIEAIRLEHSKREKERQRERDSEREKDRQLVLANYFRYSSQNLLSRVFASVGTQTSPEVNFSFNTIGLHSDGSFASMLASNFTCNPSTSTTPRAKRALMYAPDSQLEQDENIRADVRSDSATQPEDSSPDNLQLGPTATLSFNWSEDSTETTTELLIRDKHSHCSRCTKKKKKEKSKKTRLASFFCIKKED